MEQSGKPDPQELLDLVGLAYEVAVSGESWDPLLERTSALFGGVGTIFFVQDRLASHVNFARLWGLPDAALEEYEAYFARKDYLDLFSEYRQGTIVTDEALPSELRRGEFHNDFRARWGIERFAGAEVFRDARRRSVFAVQAGLQRRPFDEADRERLALLVPHLRKATQLAAHVGPARGAASDFEALVERLPMGVLLLDERAEVTYANAAARGIARAADGLAILRRRLCPALPGEEQRLSAAITAALRVSASESLADVQAFPVTRPSGAPPYTVLVTPAPGSGPHRALRSPSAMVLVGDAHTQLATTSAVVADLYGLTDAEARLARSLASGESLSAYADRAGIAVSTARWVLKNVQAKTGVRRQPDLVRLLWTGPAALVAEEPEEA